MHFEVLTLFPEILEGAVGASLLGKAQARGRLSVRLTDVRDFATGRHRVCDDAPYGGGAGMVMKPEPLVAAIEAAKGRAAEGARLRTVLLSPRGRRLDQTYVQQLAALDHLILVCGRYEGVDARVLDYVDEELSIGDYVLSGGEPAALVVIDAVARLVPGVLGNCDSLAEESHASGLLEYPHYTRPVEFRGVRVPEVLLSGDHQRIARWRRALALKLTRRRRPDLFERLELTEADRALLETPDDWDGNP
ncbi:MAG: tRNA (guanosine(37)-N1)-methyltransferase TrmD [Deltaproteobacteria bacterium]|nr:MAG: tRNA (guanosine(37)-N1)-methyltransferase TrmD [Deltaproteobacteria bacterium]